uniref:Coatomer subunit delta n=1 Tax=Entomoneis paludosa TaxID=265537 RepID=A0A7S2Y5F6_9STRA|mmetsp:Transcript_10597/g.21774  ORF Transcript_10597/g.21774 Transcript_10597/m.21774 type:complete len:546 (+) Transcript_10597:34-1671(+)|eukprot:CAMPEP_0172447940 /NCGR_PEP_ID=MMETSP1065-20121228/7077_1 /TAXON_ID=265537 /ORGANISM="Amphiprora paludosa, Strain CCMP125" /LENGTH=545 /DNA_ID=CAMNT_0013199313 /DNA_START=24 /DNA_END=1661 /DNA_ORIENTATION=-
MVVLSASVCTRQGKALVSRQFVEMNRLRVEGLLAAFPKLVGHGQQHTYIETDSVRYVYQPMENAIYLLLITTKTSNIVEDLSTLRLLAKVVPDVAGGLQEHVIAENAFDLIFAFDEVITAGGYKEEATLSSIRTNLVMESHEEKIHMALKQAKEDEARKKSEEVATALRKQKMENLRQNLVSGGNAPITGQLGGMEGFGGGGPSAQSFDPFQQEAPQQQQPNFNDPYAHLAPQAAPVEAPKVLAKSGMKLGGGGLSKGGLGGIGGASGGQKDIFAAMAKEDGLSMGAGGGNAFDLSAPAKAPVAAPSTPLSLALEEKITVQMNREGDVQSCDVKGTLTLTANTEAGTMALVSIDKSVLPPNFSYATHPKVDKKSYEAQGVLSLKGGKGFPMQRGVGVLRWSYNGEDAAPLTINCWPEDEGGTINVNIEMEMTRPDLVLQDVNILLPLGTTDPPAIENIDGIYKHDPASGMLCWHFDQIDANNASGSLEFTIAGSNTDVFFPVQIGFRSETLLCPVSVTGVTHSQNGTAIPNQLVKSFSPDAYLCS